MSSVRVPGSLRSPVGKPAYAGSARKDASTTSLFTAACFAAASPTTVALAQGTTTPAPLPPLSVEAKQPKKKAATPAAKKAGAAPVAPATAAAPTPAPGSNPYANPNAPYKVEQSASGKLTEPLVNTPRTVTVTPKEVIEDKSARDLRDLARSTPGLTIGSAEGGNSYGAFAIRGFKANNDIFVDSIRNPGNVIPDVFSVQQIEIYKGPSGGIAGRSTIGGAVNIVSKAPDLRSSFYESSTTIGTDNMFRTTLDINEKVSPDFALRANLMYDNHGVAGRDITDSERWGGLISATGRISDSVKITLDYYHYRNDAIPDWGVPVRNVDHVPVTELEIPRNTWVGMKGLDFFKERADIVTGTMVVKVTNGVTLTNRSRAGESELDYVATSMEGAPDVHHPNRDQIARIYANQTELNFKFNAATFHHQLVGGLELTRETINRYGYNVTNWFDPQTPTVNPPPPPCVPLARPFPQGLQNPCYTDVILGKGKVYDATIDTLGVYLTDTVHLSKQWIVNAGIRLDDFTRDQVGGPGINAPGSAAASTAIATNTASVHANLLSWHAGLVYKPIPISSFYVAYATSQSPIGSELDSTGAQYNGISATLVNVPPQEARSIEVGTKWELFDKRTLVTAALFQTDVDHARTNDTVTPTDPTNAFKGKYRVRGIEVTTAGNVTKAWSLFGGLVLLDTEVLASSTPQDIGRRLANIPLTQFSLLSRYQLTEQLAIAGTATYGGEIYGGHLAANAANNHTVDWWRFDAFAEYKITKNIELKITGLNLFDKTYYDAIYQAGSAGPPNDIGTFAFVAPGRAGYLTLKVKY
jgi:catecholate siderophore receptor